MLSNAPRPFNFDLGEMADAIRDTVHSFSQEKIAPRADAIDKDNLFPRDLWPEMGALGLHGITVHGRMGRFGAWLSRTCRRDRGSFARVRQRWLSPTARTPICASTRSAAAATTTQKAKYLPKLISGEACRLLSPCPKPGAGQRCCVDEAPGRRDQGDRYLLNGNKMWITNGPQAETLVVYAKTDGHAGSRGMTAFLIEKGEEGFSIGQKLDKLGMRGSDYRANWC